MRMYRRGTHVGEVRARRYGRGTPRLVEGGTLLAEAPDCLGGLCNITPYPAATARWRVTCGACCVHSQGRCGADPDCCRTVGPRRSLGRCVIGSAAATVGLNDVRRGFLPSLCTCNFVPAAGLPSAVRHITVERIVENCHSFFPPAALYGWLVAPFLPSAMASHGWLTRPTPRHPLRGLAGVAGCNQWPRRWCPSTQQISHPPASEPLQGSKQGGTYRMTDSGA